MTDDIEQRLDQMLYEAEWLPDGLAKLTLLDEAVRLADMTANVDWQYRARYELAMTAALGGFPERALVAHSWMVAAFDKHPDRFPADDFLWHYKRTVSVLDEFPQISRAKIEEVFEDLRGRYEREGMSLRGYYSRRLYAARGMGDDWRPFAPAWRHAPSDGSQDCAACERDTAVNVLLWEGKLPQALKHAKPLLDGRMDCHSVPHRTLSELMLHVWRAGDHAGALEMQRRGYALIRTDPSKLHLIGRHLELLGMAGMHAEAMRMFERHARWLDQNTSPMDHLWFLRGARVTLAAAQKLSPTQTRRLRLPESLPCWRKDGEYTLTDLLAWVDARLDELSAAFDARNGNETYRKALAELRAITPAPAPKRKPATKKKPAPKGRRSR